MRRPAASVVVAVGAACLLAACGQVHSDRRPVASYVRHVQLVETALGEPLSVIGNVGSSLRADLGRNSGARRRLALASTERKLSGALHQMTSLRAQLAALRAPAAAAHLRLLVLRLADRQIALTREVARLVRFLPQFSSDLRPLAAATRRLQAALSSTGSIPASEVSATYTVRAAALDGFSRSVRKIIARLARLHPPPVSAPGYRTQMVSLRGINRAAERLAAALRTQQLNKVSGLRLAFDRAARLNQTVGAQRAQIAAVRAYDRRITSLKDLVIAIDRERARLDHLLA